MNEERMQILRMIAEKKISAEDGAKLLAALKPRPARPPTPPVPPVPPGEIPSLSGRWFRVRVTDMKTGRRKVNVNIPLGLVNAGLKLGARFGTSNFDMNEVIAAIREGASGKIIEMEDAEDGERVEVFVE